MDFVPRDPEVDWGAMRACGGCYSAKTIGNRIADLRGRVTVGEGSLLARLLHVAELDDRRKALEGQLKSTKTSKGKLELLRDDTKTAIENLGAQQALELLRIKWVGSLMDELYAIPGEIIDGLAASVQRLNDKYAVTYEDVDNRIAEAESELVELLGQLTGGDDDVAGVGELARLLGGE